MGTSGFESAISYVQARIAEEWRAVAPPDFFTTVRDADWPNFGIPNRNIFTGVDATTQRGIPNGSAGRISQTVTTSRQIQLGLKLAF